jgi:hypothetical protein
LESPGVRWLIETHSLDLERGCIELLAGHGYVTRIIPNAWWRIAVPEQRHGEINRWLAAYREDRQPGGITEKRRISSARGTN